MAESLSHVGSVDVGDKVKGLLAVAIVFKSFCDHDRAAEIPISYKIH